MAMIKKDSEGALDLFDRFFSHWPEMFRRPVTFWPANLAGLLQVDEFVDDGALVIRTEIPGIDAEKDLEITVEDDVLHIVAERKEDETKQEKDYYRHELRYGSFRRYLQLPATVEPSDVKAVYKDGVLEIRVPVPKVDEEKRTASRIPVTAG